MQGTYGGSVAAYERQLASFEQVVVIEAVAVVPHEHSMSAGQQVRGDRGGTRLSALGTFKAQGFLKHCGRHHHR